MGRLKRVQQAEKIRDAAIESLLEQVEVPLPEAVVQAQVDETVHNALHGLDHDEDRLAEALAEQGSSREEFDAEARENAEKAVKAQLLVDAIADELKVQVGQDDMTERLVLQSRQYGVEPQQLLQFLQENNQLPAMFADVRRGKALAIVVRGATVKDTAGNTIDTAEFFGPRQEAAGADSDAAVAAEEEAEEARRRTQPKKKPKKVTKTTASNAVSEPAVVGSASPAELVSVRDNASKTARKQVPAVTDMRASAPGLNLVDSVYERLLAERIIFLGSQVDDDIANRLCAQILLLAAEDPTKDIHLYINSPGGSISAGMAIYDTMVLAPCDVATYAMGMAASMGQFLLAAGTKGKRFALPHARILMHQPMGGVTGSASDIAIQAEQFAVIKKEMFRLNAEFTGQSEERIVEDSDRDRWFTAEEALEYGFVDHIIARADINGVAPK